MRTATGPAWTRLPFPLTPPESEAGASRRPANIGAAAAANRRYNQRVPPIIRASHLGKTYKTGKVLVPALKDATFSVEPGEFVSIVGPSGSGKSTLFYILGGLTRATTGNIFIDEVDFAALNDSDRTEMRKSKIGFIFQKFNLLPTLTARGNIEIAYEISGRNKAGQPVDQRRLNDLADLLGIAGRLDHRPSELSGGEQQRVAIARALITQPAIVLADEPTGNLDTENSLAVLSMLRKSNQEFKQTVLMITHNPEAAQIGDRILTMRDGKISEQGMAGAAPAHSGSVVLPTH